MATSKTKTKKRGRRPDPAKRGLRKVLVALKPAHWAALRRAALRRELDGLDARADAAGVLRLLLDDWLGAGARAPGLKQP
jgi:hypothetical protein